MYFYNLAGNGEHAGHLYLCEWLKLRPCRQYESITRLPIIYAAFEARLYMQLIDSKDSRENTGV